MIAFRIINISKKGALIMKKLLLTLSSLAVIGLGMVGSSSAATGSITIHNNSQVSVQVQIKNGSTWQSIETDGSRISPGGSFTIATVHSAKYYRCNPLSGKNSSYTNCEQRGSSLMHKTSWIIDDNISQKVE